MKKATKKRKDNPKVTRCWGLIERDGSVVPKSFSTHGTHWPDKGFKERKRWHRLVEFLLVPVPASEGGAP